MKNIFSSGPAYTHFYSRKNFWKIVLLTFMVLIGGVTLYYTESLAEELRIEERKKVELWADAINIAAYAEPGEDLNLANKILINNTTIPIILADEEDNIISTNNLSSSQERKIKTTLQKMKQKKNVITIDLGDGLFNKLYYDESRLLYQLRIYPRILLGVIASFMLLAYVAFSNARKAEQDRVWNGLAKETAHQIGTPLSSLLGWLEILKTGEHDPLMVAEMQKDLDRLQKITGRFSKIGSQPNLDYGDLRSIINESTEYLQFRIPKRVQIQQIFPEQPVMAYFNPLLMEWVLENLIRNALDAIEGHGLVTISLEHKDKKIEISVSDTGKGIPRHLQKAIFRPGFTTKNRGWGLGLSLAKRIITDYHRGKIFVAYSEPGKGTTFKIILPATL
ncbi:sensor histidine kinase [Schleiferia thermophila]|uniref:sensor histidine kinase n=1 Tax=Schleiferia thermophila TaxID=884107 RepID=UPI0004E63051|nr:HAMP domain-containing sensor histidine kinase [Schleiferia thermophila]KFD39469.1 sensor histidine kinase [Schleiferia thermophila str. Yellowstone]